MINLTLTAEQVNLLMQALAELPYRVSAPTLAEIDKQVRDQVSRASQDKHVATTIKANGASVDASEFGQAHQ